MIPNPPWCAGRTEFHPRPHVQTTMRVEVTAGAVGMYRCPECHHSAPMFDDEPIDARYMRDEFVALLNGETVDRHREEWSRPVRLRFVDDPRGGRLVQIQARNV